MAVITGCGGAQKSAEQAALSIEEVTALNMDKAK